MQQRSARAAKPRRAGASRAIGIGLLVILGLSAGCKTPEVLYWSRRGGKQTQFSRDSGRCGDLAVNEATKLGNNVCITQPGRNGGSICGQVDPNSPDQKRRKQRRLSYVYRQCMETQGWRSSPDEAKGFRGLY